MLDSTRVKISSLIWLHVGFVQGRKSKEAVHHIVVGKSDFRELVSPDSHDKIYIMTLGEYVLCIPQVVMHQLNIQLPIPVDSR